MTGTPAGVGFTGTRAGMTEAQKVSVRRVLERIGARYGNLVVHGDCKGADEQFDGIAAGLGLERHIYPCDIEYMRAHCELRGAKQMREPARPLVRNGWIVEVTLVMMATPKEYVEELRSGTWATVRRSRKSPNPLILIPPDGSLTK